MPDQLAEAVEKKLEALGHLEVLDPGWLPRACLDARSLLVFRASHRRRLETWSGKLEAAPPSADVLAARGRLHWLLGRGRRARRDLTAALALEPKAPRALAYWGVSLIGTAPEAAVGVLREASAAEPSRNWPRLWLAAARLKTKKPAEARRALEGLERTPAGGFLASFLKALAHLRLARHRELAVEAGRLIAASPSGSAGHGARAVARLALGDWHGAFSDYNEARDRDPDCGFDIAESFLRGRAGRSGEEFLDGATNALQGHPARACFYAVRAERLRSPAFCRYDAALEDYRRAEALEPDSAWIQAQMARAEGPSAGPRAVLRRLDRAAALRPEAGWIYAWRGEAKRQLGRDDAALEDFERCLRLMPWYGHAYAWKGAVLTRLGRFSEAEPVLTAALDLRAAGSTGALAYHQRSLCRRALGDDDGAMKDRTAAYLRNNKYEWAPEDADGDGVVELDRLLARRPRQAWTYAWRGRAFMKRGDPAAAAADFSKALAFQRSNAHFRTWRGTALRAIGRTAQARLDFARALRLGRGRGLPAIYLAEMKLEQGRAREALALVGRSGDESIDASFFMSKARLLLRLGKGREALASMKRAAALYPLYADDYESAARVLEGRESSSAACSEAAALP